MKLFLGVSKKKDVGKETDNNRYSPSCGSCPKTFCVTPNGMRKAL